VELGNPAPQVNALGAIDFQAGRGYAVGAAGTALGSDDGGKTFHKIFIVAETDCPDRVRAATFRRLRAAHDRRRPVLRQADRDPGTAASATRGGGNGPELARRFFFTATGGDAGVASPLQIKATPSKLSKKSLKRTRGRVTITGTLGGEQITVSARAETASTGRAGPWTAGANGGSFSATFNVQNAAVFVAQWAGDSGRIGEGTAPLVVKVTN
jgi:hypothetical protein